MLPFCNNTNKTIHINPNFKGQLPTPETCASMQTTSAIPKNTHINPLFLDAHKLRPTIHMNPAFLHKFQEHQEIQPQQHKATKKNNMPENEHKKLTNQAIEIATNPPSCENSVITETRKIICKSKNRLIREPLVKNDGSFSKLTKPSIPQQPLLVLNRRKLIRKVSNIPLIFSKTESNSCNDGKGMITKYKLDNRVIKKRALLPPTPKIKRTSYVGRYALRRTSLSETPNILNKSMLSINKTINKKLEVLNINGLLYKSTRNSLKLKDLLPARPCNNGMLKSSKANLSSQKLSVNTNQGLTIFVRGTKYVMDANKFKLTRVTNTGNTSPKLLNSNNSSKSLTCQRIDIGGYTYVSINSAKNVLIRTTNHLSRAYVHNAKLKSMIMLSKRLVKSNIPCPIFQRIGKCAAFERGKCLKVHNKLHVAICSKFLRGECLKSNCLLSHNVSLSKMPVCKFFLQGVCVRNDCPYLHKKLSNKAELCTDFQRGFCQLADKCNKRHEFVCPEIERNNICKTKNCVYCNAKRRKETHIEKKSEKQNVHNSTLPSNSRREEENENPSCTRYFIEPCDKTVKTPNGKRNTKLTNELTTEYTNSNEYSDQLVENSRRSRPKLGALPAYIPL